MCESPPRELHRLTGSPSIGARRFPGTLRRSGRHRVPRRPLAGAMRPKALAGPQEAQGTKLFAENPPAFIRGAGPDLSLRHPGEKRAVVAGFDGGRMTSDSGALLRGATDRAIGLVERFAVCFTDDRTAELIEHEVRTLIGQRVLAIVLGYEGLVDHDQLRHDPDTGGAGRQAGGTLRRWRAGPSYALPGQAPAAEPGALKLNPGV